MEELLSRAVPADRVAGAGTPGPHKRYLRIGEMLVNARLINIAQVSEALVKQASWGSRLGDIILAMGWVKPMEFYRVLAGHFGLEFVNLSEQPVDEALLAESDYLDHAKHLYLPWRVLDGVLWIVTAEPGSPRMQGPAPPPARCSPRRELQVRHTVGAAENCRARLQSAGQHRAGSNRPRTLRQNRRDP